MSKKRVTRIQVMLDDEELSTIDQWRFEQRMPSRAAAIRAMIHIAVNSGQQAGLNSADGTIIPVKSSEIGIVETQPHVAAALGTASRKKILVVEDEYLIAEGLAKVVRSAGFEPVGPALTLDEAETLIENTELHGAILDIDISGRTVATIANDLINREIPFAFCSAHEVGARLPGHLHDRPLMTKPIVRNQLQETLAGLCGDAVLAS